MFTVLLVVVIIVCILDFSKILKNGGTIDKVFFLLIAAATIAYGYYYNTHLYTASIAKILIKLFGIPH
jgi:hypothetical protein